MLAAIAWWRSIAASSARFTAPTVTDSMDEVIEVFLSSLHDELGMEGAGRLDRTQDGDDVARAGLHPHQALHELGHGVVGSGHEAALLLFLRVHAGILDHLGAHAGT